MIGGYYLVIDVTFHDEFIYVILQDTLLVALLVLRDAICNC